LALKGDKDTGGLEKVYKAYRNILKQPSAKPNFPDNLTPKTDSISDIIFNQSINHLEY